MKRSNWNPFDVIDRVGPCNALMIVGETSHQVAEAIIVALCAAADELRAEPDTELFVRHDRWGNCLVLREPVPERFVGALLAGLPNARVVPVDFGDSLPRRVLTIGKRGVEVHPESGSARPAQDANRWDTFGERWGSEWSASRYYEYRRATPAPAATPAREAA